MSEEFRIKYSKIPWKSIAGMRDIVVHGYESIKGSLLEDVDLQEILIYKAS